MKQKIVIKVPMMNTQKKRAKAMKIVVGVQGFESVSLSGPDKTQIEVAGVGIDSVALVTLLRKKIGFAELDSVGPVEEKKKDDNKQQDPKPALQWPSPVPNWPLFGYGGGSLCYCYN